MTQKDNLLKEADSRIDKFEKWFLHQGAEPLAKFERAILKTFLLAEHTDSFKEFFDPEGANSNE
jgi:hypothetical protein